MKLLDYTSDTILQLFRDSYYSQYGTPLTIGSDEFTSSAVFTYVLSILMNAMNKASDQRFIDTATGAFLDAIAGVNGLTRPAPRAASAAFIIHGISTGTTIPKEALRLGNGALHFTNEEPIYLNVLDKNVLLYCTEEGTKGNNYPENTFTILESGASYIYSGSNISKTGGGFDGFAYDEEGDAGFRTWIKEMRSAYIVGGSAPAYRSKALEQDMRIIDSYVAKDGDSVYEKGKVKIYNLYDFDVVNTFAQNLINQKVEDACKAEDFRPIGDYVEVASAGQRLFQLSSSFKIKYPLAFRDSCVEHMNRIFREYRVYLYSGFRRAFSESELAKRLVTPDDNGVYALAFDYTGGQGTWIRPDVNEVYLLTWLYMNTYQTKTYKDYVDAGVLELIDTGV